MSIGMCICDGNVCMHVCACVMSSACVPVHVVVSLHVHMFVYGLCVVHVCTYECQCVLMCDEDMYVHVCVHVCALYAG